MQVTFKNTGMIEEAGIRLDGLTVIAGENDTGKSTVGKLLYSLIKTFNRYEKDARVYQLGQVKNSIENHYNNFKKEHNHSSGYEEVETFFDELESEALALLEKPLSRKKMESVLAEKIKSFTEIIKAVSGGETNLEEIPGQIAGIIDKKPLKEEIFKRSFGKYMGSVLGGEVANKFAKDRVYSITGTEGKDKIFEISGNNGSLKLHLDSQLYFEDATFIESPVLLNLADSIRFSTTEFDGNGDIKKQVELLGKAYAMEYMKDLILKLTNRNTRAEPSKIVDEVRDIINGDFYYDREERDFVFEKGKQTFKGGAIASGIKYLGMVSILLLAGFIDKKSLLVIDEPETHMHPQWQMRFAEVLVKLAKEGNHILLTSHSPYLIEAIKVFSDKTCLKEKTVFYLGEKNKTTFTSRIIEVTHDISPIFELLAEPYEKLERLQSLDDGE